VLDIGCATGYSTAVLASLGRHVTGLEPEPELAAAARENLRALGLATADIVEGPLGAGFAARAPYDVIMLNGSVPDVPASLFAQLKQGGRLAGVLSGRANRSSQGRAYLFIKVGSELSGLPHFDAGARPLPGFTPESCFSF
jgi:protein-L-isoaspartate(D-aspartate) O-methyltransferase